MALADTPAPVPTGIGEDVWTPVPTSRLPENISPVATAPTPSVQSAVAPFADRIAQVNDVEPGLGRFPTEKPPIPTAANPGSDPVLPATSLPITTSRLHGDAYLALRGGPTADSLAFGQLGASQAGLRLTYALGDARRVALSGRVSAPVRGRGREAGLGIDWRPTRLPVHLLAEERVSLDGGGGHPAVQLIAGFVQPWPARLSLETYGEAGVIATRGGFADGAARIGRPLLERRAVRLDLAAGGWAAAQRGAARFDIGPSVGLSVPVGKASVRLALDYRVRVAGRARPGSGPALTLGSSF